MKLDNKSISIYIAGPMTGIEDFNIPKFNKVAELLRKIPNYTVINPANVTPQTNLSFEQYMAIDLPLVCICDVIVMLDGWEKSKGANRELMVAMSMGKYIAEIHKMNDESILLRRMITPKPKDILFEI